MNLDDDNRGFINAARIATMKKGAIDHQHRPRRPGRRSRTSPRPASPAKLGGYGSRRARPRAHAASRHPFEDIDNIIVTPHVGSRTFESVERQAMRARR